MDWIMECNETVESAWSEAESAAKAKGEDLERNYTHCEYDDVQTNFIYSQVRSRKEVLELVLLFFFLLLLLLLEIGTAC